MINNNNIISRIEKEINIVNDVNITYINFDKKNIILVVIYNNMTFKFKKYPDDYPFSCPKMYIGDNEIYIDSWSPAYYFINMIELFLISQNVIESNIIKEHIKNNLIDTNITNLIYDDSKLLLTFNYNNNNYKILFSKNYPYIAPILYTNNIKKKINFWSFKYNLKDILYVDDEIKKYN
jgi:hypothetical protein